MGGSCPVAQCLRGVNGKHLRTRGLPFQQRQVNVPHCPRAWPQTGESKLESSLTWKTLDPRPSRVLPHWSKH